MGAKGHADGGVQVGAGGSVLGPPYPWPGPQDLALPTCPGARPSSVTEVGLSIFLWIQGLIEKQVSSEHGGGLEGPFQAGCPQCPLLDSSLLAFTGRAKGLLSLTSQQFPPPGP